MENFDYINDVKQASEKTISILESRKAFLLAFVEKIDEALKTAKEIEQGIASIEKRIAACGGAPGADIDREIRAMADSVTETAEKFSKMGRDWCDARGGEE